MDAILSKIAAFLLTPIIAISGFLAPFQETPPPTAPAPSYGSITNSFVGGKAYFVGGSGISSSATSISLTSFTLPVTDANITIAHFAGGVGYGTLEPGSAEKQEFISFTGITQNANGSATLTGVSRGLLPVSPYTASTTYAQSHSGGSVFILSDAPGLYQKMIDYADALAIAGAPDASTLVKGLGELATGIEAASSTSTGGSGPLVLPASLATSTYNSSTASLRILMSDNSGKVDEDFIPSTLANAYTFSNSITQATTTSHGFNVVNTTNAATSTTITGTTFTVPAGITKLRLRAWGAGAAGSGAADTDATAYDLQNTMHGLPGNYCEAVATVSPGDVFNITIGAGGVGASGYNNAGGAAGAATTIVDNAGAGSFTLTAPAGQSGRSYGAACTISGSKLVTGSITSVIGAGAAGGTMPEPNSTAAQTGGSGQSGRVTIDW